MLASGAGPAAGGGAGGCSASGTADSCGGGGLAVAGHCGVCSAACCLTGVCGSSGGAAPSQASTAAALAVGGAADPMRLLEHVEGPFGLLGGGAAGEYESLAAPGAAQPAAASGGGYDLEALAGYGCFGAGFGGGYAGLGDASGGGGLACYAGEFAGGGGSSGAERRREERLIADCGVCRFCLNKKKFGGTGSLKAACIRKQARVSWWYTCSGRPPSPPLTLTPSPTLHNPPLTRPSSPRTASRRPPAAV